MSPKKDFCGDSIKGSQESFYIKRKGFLGVCFSFKVAHAAPKAHSALLITD